LNPLRACDIDARSYLGTFEDLSSDVQLQTCQGFHHPGLQAGSRRPRYRAPIHDRSDPAASDLTFFATISAAKRTTTPSVAKTWSTSWPSSQTKSGQSGHTCHVASKIASTQTSMEVLRNDPVHIRGYGLNVKVNGASAKLLLDTGGRRYFDRQKNRRREGWGEEDCRNRGLGGIGDKAAASGYLAFADSIQIGDLQFEGCDVDVVNRNSRVG
jgi:hypothetical protein